MCPCKAAFTLQILSSDYLVRFFIYISHHQNQPKTVIGDIVPKQRILVAPNDSLHKRKIKWKNLQCNAALVFLTYNIHFVIHCCDSIDFAVLCLSD